MKKKKKFILLLVLLLLVSVAGLSACKSKNKVDGKFNFVIYESDNDNNDLSDNVVVVSYEILYNDCSVVTETFIVEGNKYYFNEDKVDYLVFENGAYGLNYTNGYFKNYDECIDGEIDVSWSMTFVNGKLASTSIGETPLEGLDEFGFVINGWK